MLEGVRGKMSPTFGSFCRTRAPLIRRFFILGQKNLGWG